MSNNNDRWMPPPKEESLPAHLPTVDEMIDGSNMIDLLTLQAEGDAVFGIEEKSPVTLKLGELPT